jgi:ABC-type branched-subunit amino acid transport system ATPase component
MDNAGRPSYDPPAHRRITDPPVSAALLEVRNLFKTYPGPTPVVAVDGVSLAVPEGVCFGLLGPNGAGKTTTIEIMEGILGASAGEVFFRGEPIGRRFKEEAGILFQKTALQDFLTVRQSLTLSHQAVRAGEAGSARHAQAFRRPAAAPAPGDRAGERPCPHFPGRADDRPRSAGAP